MEAVFDKIAQINNSVNGIVWGIPMLVLIIATGIYMTVGTGFFQVKRAKHVSRETFLAIFRKKSVTKTKDKKAISQFQALSTALAATIGTGNIAGVATAIAIGGPGAVFWMWVSAFFGMMTNYSENVLGIYYRKKNDHGEWSGGAMYYLKEGVGRKKGLGGLGKVLAVLFSIFCVMASFGIGNMTQVNSISSAVESNFGVSTLATGIALACIAGLVIVGGIKRIASVTEKLVPFMALAYILGTLTIFIMNYRQIPYVFSSIFRDAFNFTAVAGGGAGFMIKKAVTMGFKRGVFSNEAGLGSSVMVHSASDVKEPVIQGMWGIFEVFFDTIIVCTLTAFVLLSSSAKAVTLETALANVTTETQYFEIYDGEKYDGQEIALIDSQQNETIVLADSDTPDDQKGAPITAVFNGHEYTVDTLGTDAKGEDDYVFTNVMAVKAQPAKDSDGNQLFNEDGSEKYEISISKVNGVPLVTYAVSQHFGSAAGKFLTIAILLFAFSTVLGWSFYGTKSMEFLFGTKSTIIYKIIFVLFIVVGATMSLDLAWDIADTLNGLMALPNLIGVLLLSPVVFKITKNYVGRKIKKNTPDAEPMISAYPDIQAEQAAKIYEEDAVSDAVGNK
jgi:amino acid carrier protein